jgi:hypothetical protein
MHTHRIAPTSNKTLFSQVFLNAKSAIPKLYKSLRCNIST